MKLLVCLVVCSHFYNSVLSPPTDKSFDIDLQKNNATGKNVTSYEQRLLSVERKMSLLIGKGFKYNHQFLVYDSITKRYQNF